MFYRCGQYANSIGGCNGIIEGEAGRVNAATAVWVSGSAAFAMFMHKTKYAALPADVRQVLDDTTSRLSYWKQVGVGGTAWLAGWPVALATLKQSPFERASSYTLVVVQIGLIAPPVGLNVFVIGGMARDVPLATIYRGIMPFLVAQIVLLILLTLWPGMALLLPGTMQ